MKKKNYNKYGEYIGKTVITRSQIEKRMRWLGDGEFVVSLLVTMIVSPLMLALLPYLIKSFQQTIAHTDQMLKYQRVGQYLFHLVGIIAIVGVPVALVGVTVWSFIRALKMRKGEFSVEVDEVNYLDVVVRRRRKHTEERLVIFFYKYGRYETVYPFDNLFAEHNEKFYVVVTKEEKPQILDIYRFSKFEYQE